MSLINKFSDVKGKYPEIKICCPYCTDSRYRLGINLKKMVGHCFNCGEKLNKKKILSLVDSSLLKPRVSKGEVESEDVVPLQLQAMAFREAKKNFSYFRLYDRACRFLEGRGFDPEEVAEDYNFMLPTRESRLVNRIILPIIEQGKILSYQARTLVNASPKYINPPKTLGGKSKSGLVYNLDRAKEFEEIVICEGIFSSISVGPDAVAIFGKDLSDAQAAKIFSSAIKKVVIMLDPDAQKLSKKIADKLYPRVEVRIATIKNGDPNDVEKSEILEARIAAEKFFDGNFI